MIAVHSNGNIIKPDLAATGNNLVHIVDGVFLPNCCGL